MTKHWRRVRCTAVVALSSSVIVAGFLPTSGAALPTGTTPVSVTAGETHAGVNASLDRIGGTLTVRVTIKGTSIPVRGASVGLVEARSDRPPARPQFSHSDETRANGRSSLTGLPAARYYVCVTTFDLPRRDARYGLAGQCYGSPTPYSYGDRARGKPVAVHLGATRTIHVPLTRDGAIAGAVRTGAGQPVSGAEVTAVHHGHLVSSDTSVHGAYTMDGLPAGRYRVCVTPNHHTTVDSGRAAPTGYLQRCAPHAPRRIRVRADEVTRHVNVRLPVGGAIAGLVQSSTRGHPPVADSRVTIYRGTKAVRRHVFTDGDGNFRVTGLAPRPSYAVCARHGYVRTLPGKTFAGRCWRTAAWDGQRVPAAARRIAVTAGDTTRDINLRLRPVPAEPVGTGGSVKGTVTYDGQPVANVEVAIFRNGHELSYGEAGQPTTYDDGSYQVWLDGGDYQICFAPPPVGEHEPGGTPPTGWAGVCYGQTPYDGGPVPPGAATVHVESSNVRGIDAQLRLGGAISGTLQSRGQPLRGATVWIFDGASSAVRGIARTNRNGRYRLTSLAPSEPGYVVCFQSNGRPLSECYDGIPWTH